MSGSGFLGWNDRNQVLLSKAEGLRAELDDKKDRSPEHAFVTTSRRKHRTVRVDEKARADKEEAAAFTTDEELVFSKKGDSRVKWLYKALLLAGKKTIPVNRVYETIMSRRFLSDVTDVQGNRIYKLLNANLHIFSSKQQKHIQSESAGFTAFKNVAVAEKPEKKGKSKKSKDKEGHERRKRSRSCSAPARRSPARRSRSSSDDRRRTRHRSRHRDAGSCSRSRSRRRPDAVVPPESAASERRASAVEDNESEDPRLSAPGALDDFL
mmetsp:Transcript_16790/g.28982  ORF Transcript_16790/g.28982 Transcript_16790/m.28982 type:complete len:267 (-) Transcript_16790:85-885(-)